MSDLNKLVGGRIRDLRLKRGLTQEKLGERAGLSYKFVGEVERGVANPTLDTLGRLADAIGVELFELVKPSYEPAVISAADYAAVQQVRESLDKFMVRFRPRRRSRTRTQR